MTEPEFGERLRQFRKNKSMTQQDLADLLGVSNKSVSRWESGSYPDVALLGSLAKVLGVTVDDLLGESPQLRTLDRADWQNLLSFVFALGGGILFFLLDLFAPAMLCYGIYLGLMAYGVYLQKNYTFHSRWFHIGNLVVNFFVNLQLTSVVLLLMGFSIQSAAEEFFNHLVYGSSTFGFFLYYGRYYVLWFVVASILTTGTGYIIWRYWKGTTKDVPALRLNFSPANFSIRRGLPVICPILLAGYWYLFTAEEAAALPTWCYLHQKGLYWGIWAVLAALTVLWLLWRKEKGMLFPASIMLLITTTFTGMLTYDRYIGVGTGNIYESGSVQLNPNSYVHFGEPGWAVLVWAVVLVAVYLLCCFISLRKQEAGMEEPGECV